MTFADSAVDFVKNYGYIAVFLGSIVEGESVILVASALAACGCLSICKIFTIACLTTIFVDQIMFFIGYKFGISWLVNKSQKLLRARDKVFSLLHKMDILFIFLFRFIYGIRTISPLVIGSARINPSRFIFFNALSGICWAFVSCFIGYKISDIFVDGEKFDITKVMIIVSVIVLITMCVAFFVKGKIIKKQ